MVPARMAIHSAAVFATQSNNPATEVPSATGMVVAFVSTMALPPFVRCGVYQKYFIM
jgi:hypothetical protein